MQLMGAARGGAGGEGRPLPWRYVAGLGPTPHRLRYRPVVELRGPGLMPPIALADAEAATPHGKNDIEGMRRSDVRRGHMVAP